MPLRDEKGRFVKATAGGLLVVTTESQMSNVQESAEKATFRNLGHGAASVRKDVQASIVKAEGPSQEGSPPHTHNRIFLRRAIRFHVDRKKEVAVIGPVASIVGQSGAAHEFGEVYRGTNYPERPYMGPGLERGAPRFGNEFQGSIGR